MAALPVQGACKPARGTGSHRGAPSPSPSPESSLTWCLNHLFKPVPKTTEEPGTRTEDTSCCRKESDKRSKAAQWRALVAIRTQHIKGGSTGISRFRTQGGLCPLLKLLQDPDCSRKTLDLALSILGNCCTELATRVQVRKLDGVPIVVDILKRNVTTDTVQNRAARALGNLAMDPQNSALIHSSAGVCSGALSALAPLMAPELPQGLQRAALRALHEVTRGCGVECAREVSRAGVLPRLGAMASGDESEPPEELALKALANLCSQGCLRPLVGSLDVIRRFAREAERGALKAPVFLKALCLCCKEAVNRAKVKACGGLETLVGFLAAHGSHPLSRMAIVACVDFVYDEAALEQLQELGLVPLLSFDFPAIEGRKEEAKDQGLGSSSFLSLRSWLLSEGLISSEGDLLESPAQQPQVSSPGDVPEASPDVCASAQAPSTSRPGCVSPFSSPAKTPQMPSPVLLLLSRFSHAPDPSAALVTPLVLRGLLYYVSRHRDPSSRCFRMLCRLSCNPNCLHALVRTGAPALIRHHLCRPAERGGAGGGRQTGRVRAKVKQLGLALLNNLRIQCESAFGSGMMAHAMLSGSEPDKLNCALSLPLISSNKALLKKLLLDSGGLLVALQPLGCHAADGGEDAHAVECGRLLPNCFSSPPPVPASQLHALYLSLLIGCLSALLSGGGRAGDVARKPPIRTDAFPDAAESAQGSAPAAKKPRLDRLCPYRGATFDLLFQLDDGTRLPANREAVSAGSEYFRALLGGGFQEASGNAGTAIPIRDVSRGTLLPVLHYQHGCRLPAPSEGDVEWAGVGGPCQVLGSLSRETLAVIPLRTEPDGAEKRDFQDSPLGETMVGACRFLVAELQREAEQLCVELLLAHTSATTPLRDQGGPVGESTDKGLARRNSLLAETGALQPLEHQGTEKPAEGNSSHAVCGSSSSANTDGTSRAARKLVMTGEPDLPPQDPKPLPRPGCGSKPGGPGPKKALRSSKSATPDPSPCSWSAAGGDSRALWAVLPQVYWFSQRYSYPALGRACLSLLLGAQRGPRPLPRPAGSSSSSSSPGDCLGRLAKEADCTKTLKQDLLDLVALALS
ncbi:hypothetical protein NHX12_031495 [Muraenolepis orangiensis]|uniref:BTB domain-containing protein n=1 Tax=Muraenolepis orangiensis TaxID=630683 RepID=A0A9Q0E3U3_9TELE|nr:hypothetical protein NHX12_031495 [Muraenolepis orangiensis]